MIMKKQEIKKNLNCHFLEKNNLFTSLEQQNENIIGSDEVGTGDVFGPIVVCAVLVNQKQIPFLKQIDIKDSKKLSPFQIQKIMNEIKGKFLYQVKIVSPPEYNKLNKIYNLNKIKALSHNHIILNISKKIKKKIVILDQFVNYKLYFNYLKEEKEIYKDIIFETKADSKYMSVALASIIARSIFLNEIKKINKKIGINLFLGASYKVDEQIKQIYQKKNLIFLQKIAKCNFKNIKRNTQNIDK
ncbi:MAG: ribonuclease HIII [Candidatus Phytoplasma stylosanthis]|nr:ribonuclease HIII [Candidatus Phytoplasma stylosanthis]